MMIYLYTSKCKALLDTNFWFYEYIVFYTLSMPSIIATAMSSN